MPRCTVVRRAHFNAAHRLHNPAKSEAWNAATFGKCNNPNYHGHNYTLELKVIGAVDPQTGYVVDLKILKDIIREEVEERFDHKNLNLDCPEFEGLNPTAENIAIVIFNLIRARLSPHLDMQVRLYETEKNYVEYPV